MNGFFLHRPFFRLLIPLLIGNMAYLLILLLNNNVEQLQEQFLGEELYFSCAVALLLQEVNRLMLRYSPAFQNATSLIWQLTSKTLVALLISVVMTIAAVGTYYKFVLGYWPDISEWMMFVGIFNFFITLQLLLFMSQQLLQHSNQRRLLEEQERKENIEADFNQFKRGINPDLLFESLEALIVCLHKDKNEADELLDQLSTVYRYILGGRTKELVPISEEISVMKELLALFNKLPYRNLTLRDTVETDGWVVPGALLVLAEQIMRKSIVFPDQAIDLALDRSPTHFLLRYKAAEKIEPSNKKNQLESLQKSYRVYSSLSLILDTSKEEKVVGVPIIYMNPVV